MMDYVNQTLEGRLQPGAVQGSMVTKEPEIPHRLNRLFNDMQELRETVLYLSSKLEPIMTMGGPTKGRPEHALQDPSTALSSRVAEINMVVDDTRSIVADIIDRLEI